MATCMFCAKHKSSKHACFHVNFPFNAYFYPNSKGYIVKAGLLLMTSLAMT